nr:hypothetical protein BaRGS_017399 [Batillaria attramentaria]
MFAGYQQQDSQEFLTFLLDGLHEGLNEVKVRPQIPDQENDRLPDHEAAKIAWENHKRLHRSIIVELFQVVWFVSDGMWMQKKTTYVDFPVNDLDLGEFMIGPRHRSRYNLYGVSTSAAFVLYYSSIELKAPQFKPHF